MFQIIIYSQRVKSKKYNSSYIIFFFIFSMIAEQHYAIFVDNSGSVDGCTQYWNVVNSIVNEYEKDISHYYFWNSRCQLSSKMQFEEFILSKCGTGGTSPEKVAEEIANKKFAKIILITDGQVDDNSVLKCDVILDKVKQTENFQIKKAICYVIVEYGEPNLSVTCPFTRFSESKVFTKKGLEPLKSVMQNASQDLKILDLLEVITYEDFQAKYDIIEKLIIAQNMGKNGNLPLKNQLIALKTRLVKQFSQKMIKQGHQSSKVRLLLETIDAETLEAANMPAKHFEESGTTEFYKQLTHLISLCAYLISLCGDMRGQYSLGQIQTKKMATPHNLVAQEVEKDQELSDNPNKFCINVCPLDSINKKLEQEQLQAVEQVQTSKSQSQSLTPLLSKSSQKAYEGLPPSRKTYTHKYIHIIRRLTAYTIYLIKLFLLLILGESKQKIEM